MKIDKLVVGNLATNCYIVSSKKGNAFVIDPGDDALFIKSRISEDKLNAKFIINTHGHIDHIKGSALLSLPVYLHEKDRDMVSDPQKNHMTLLFGSFAPIVPERLLKDGDEVRLDELVFKVIHTPGHTKGGICLLGGGVLFSGDTLFKGGVGRTDFLGASYKDLEASLKKLSRLEGDTIVYPGHGPQTTIAEEFHS